MKENNIENKEIRKRLEVLVVEDNHEQQEFTKKQFSAPEAKAGYELTLVGSYLEAQDAMREKKHDVLVTDLFFPFGYHKNGDTYPIKKDESERIEALGYPLALQAKSSGIKHVGILSSVNHHNGPMAATTDQIGWCAVINDNKLIGNIYWLHNFIKGYVIDGRNGKDYLAATETMLGKLKIKDGVWYK